MSVFKYNYVIGTFRLALFRISLNVPMLGIQTYIYIPVIIIYIDFLNLQILIIYARCT